MSNNAKKNFNCPALMSDGRHVTDYRPSCYVHDQIQKQNGIHNSHQYRRFLQQNADKLMAINQMYYESKNHCDSCYFQPDPNGNDEYWAKYQQYIGY